MILNINLSKKEKKHNKNNNNDCDRILLHLKGEKKCGNRLRSVSYSSCIETMSIFIDFTQSTLVYSQYRYSNQ